MATDPSSLKTADTDPIRDCGSPFVAALGAALPSSFWAMPALVGCSGGADSVALLLGLVRAAPPGGLQRLVVVHAEHDLRAAAVADREFVVALAGRFGLRVVWRRLAVRSATAATRGEGLEARARRIRYECFSDVAHEVGARHVAVGHTADDQAETILQRMLRGTGLVGLGGMKAARPLCDGVALVRPLLRMARADVRGFLAAAGQDWREDASNTDRRHARNFLRHEVLQRCTAGPFPAAVEALARLGRQAEVVAGALASAAEHLLDAHARREPDGTVVLRTEPFAGLDEHLVAEVFAALWRREDWPRRDMTARHYARLAGCAGAIARGEDPVACDLPGGMRAASAGPGLLAVGPQAGRRHGQDFISTRR